MLMLSKGQKCCPLEKYDEILKEWVKDLNMIL